MTAEGVLTKVLSFPDYDTPTGKDIRSFLAGRRRYRPELQHLLFAANRWEKYDEIQSRLHRGEALVVNRYTGSNLAYGMANGLDVDWLTTLERGLPAANLVILLDAPLQSLSSRRPAGSKDRYEKDYNFQTRAQEAYRGLGRSLGWKTVDASMTVNTIQESVQALVGDALARDRGISI